MRKERKEDTQNLINSSNKMYGACRHKTKFHRYTNSQTCSADDGRTSPEKSVSGSASNNDTSPVTMTDQKSQFNFDFNYLCQPVTVTV